ncbi:hypothetical protein [Roseibaca sp. Y0-43]|uniref:hypothetical protein n=1 Tax=Roseibaca sp. Y0-43 TaxID=2816854 RepID=UPI001D0C08E9|nr:hypothetical protein [Roseibaca sp. Y0-43]
MLQDMAEAVIETLCAEGVAVRGIAERLARGWPEADVLDLVLAIATACDEVERMFGMDGPSGRRAREGWQVATLIATDLRAMQALGGQGTRAADILAYWQTQDPFFLTQDAAE